MNGKQISVMWSAVAVASLLAAAGCAQPDKPVRVLMVVGGDHHDYETLPVQLAERLTQRGSVDIDITHDLTRLDTAGLADVDVLLFKTCHQVDIGDAQKQAVLDHVTTGRGLIALHCSLWSYQDWPEWHETTGGTAIGHDRFSTYPVTVLDPWHPVMLGLGHGFEITDEPYLIDNRDPNANILIRTTNTHKDREGKLRDGPEPQVWTKNVGKGRVLAITFGHDDKSVFTENFISLLHNGIRWVAHDMPDTPHNELTSSEDQTGFKPLFNGKDLLDWDGPPANWFVENGEIVGRAEDLDHHIYMTYYEEMFKDFELRLSIKLPDTPGANSGVQFRSKRQDDYRVIGPQADVAYPSFGNLYHITGGINSLIANGWKGKGEYAVIKGGWNDLAIICKGPRIVIKLNGITTVDTTATDPTMLAPGVIALQLHKGPPMEVRFRDIRIREID